MGNLCTKSESYDQQPSINRPESSAIRDNSIAINFKAREIVLLQGDIYDEEIDAITHIQSKKLSMEGNEQLFRLGGTKIQKEILDFKKKQGTLNYGSCFYTHGGDLKCDFVIHVGIPDVKLPIDLEKETIYQSVMCALKIANEDLQLNSLGFCLFYNPNIQITPFKVATIMLSGIKKYIEAEPNSSVKHYYLVESQGPNLQTCYKALVTIFGDRCKFAISIHSEISQDLKNQLDELGTRTPSQLQRQTEQQNLENYIKQPMHYSKYSF